MDIPILALDEDIASLPYTQIASFHWEQPVPYRPAAFFRFAALRSGGLICELKCFESSPKAVYTQIDSPVYKDSCLEFFIAPVCSRSEYINIECNSVGAYLAQFGSQRDGRRSLSELCTAAPAVTPFKGRDECGDFWGVRIVLSGQLIHELYGTGYTNAVRANFYKCGDQTQTPHYAAFSPVTDMPPGFHNPSCFADFYITPEGNVIN